jgi:ATF/CREB family transcription factor
VSRLSALVGGAGVVGLGTSNGSTGQPLSMSVNMGGGKSVSVGGRGGGGYGY